MIMYSYLSENVFLTERRERMKCFETPEIKVDKFEFSDVITTSGDEVTCSLETPCLDD